MLLNILRSAYGLYWYILYAPHKDSLVCSLLFIIPCADKLCASLEYHAAKHLPVHNITQRAERHPNSSPMNTTEFPGSGKSLLASQKKGQSIATMFDGILCLIYCNTFRLL